MGSKITYKGQVLELVDDFMDIGYMAEDIVICNQDSQQKTIHKSNQDRSMTVFVSFPFAKEQFLEEILRLDAFFSHIQVGVNCYFIFDDAKHIQMDLQSKLKKFKVVFDTQEEYGNMYGTQIVTPPLYPALSKALFLISKDGAIFYIDMPEDMEKVFDLESLRIELNRAYLTYNGKGCHE